MTTTLAPAQTGAAPRGPAARDSFFAYHGFWAPGVRAFRNLNFQWKAAIITSAFAIPIAVLGASFLSGKNDAIAFSAKERDGVTYVREVLPLLDLALQQRLLATRAAAGAPVPELPDVRARVAAQMEKIDAVQRHLGAGLATEAALTQVIRRAQDLHGGATGALAMFTRQTAHVQAVIDLITAASDGSNLTLDPDLDTYYLMDGVIVRVPRMIEATAQARDLAALVADGTLPATAVQRDAGAAETLGTYQEQGLAIGLAKVYGTRPALQASLRDAASVEPMRQLHKSAAAVIHGGARADAAALRKQGTAALEQLFSLEDSLLAALDTLLAGRVQRMQRDRLLPSIIVVVCVALAAYLFHSFFVVMDGGIREVSRHIQAMGRGDLATGPHPLGRDEAGYLLDQLLQMQHSLSDTLHTVQSASDQVSTASQQVAMGTRDLARRTEEAAANLQKTASSMEQMSATVGHTAASTREAAELAGHNAELATRGGTVINDVVATMRDIHESSSRINDIIGVIDGIAFQTNILALNAAVEAARAGEQGKGFAVVAGEVRQLAQRSAAAAREIKELIEASVQKAEGGARVVQHAGHTMRDIVTAATRMNQLLGDIATATAEQTAGIALVNTSVNELDRVTQQNAALVEETSAAAASMTEQATLLAEQAGRFRLARR